MHDRLRDAMAKPWCSGYTLPKSYRAGAVDCAELIPNKDSDAMVFLFPDRCWVDVMGAWNIWCWFVNLQGCCGVGPRHKTPLDSVSKPFLEAQEKAKNLYFKYLIDFFEIISYYNNLISNMVLVIFCCTLQQFNRQSRPYPSFVLMALAMPIKMSLAMR